MCARRGKRHSQAVVVELTATAASGLPPIQVMAELAHDPGYEAVRRAPTIFSSATGIASSGAII